MVWSYTNIGKLHLVNSTVFKHSLLIKINFTKITENLMGFFFFLYREKFLHSFFIYTYTYSCPTQLLPGITVFPAVISWPLLALNEGPSLYFQHFSLYFWRFPIFPFIAKAFPKYENTWLVIISKY